MACSGSGESNFLEQGTQLSCNGICPSVVNHFDTTSIPYSFLNFSLLWELHWELFREFLVDSSESFRDQAVRKPEGNFLQTHEQMCSAGLGWLFLVISAGWEVAEPHLLGTGGSTISLCFQIKPQEISPPPTANLDRSNDKVYENVTGLVKAVIEMSSKIQPAPPEEYVPMVKVRMPF